MSQIAPDIPELEPVPPAARGLFYMSAMNAAIRMPGTLLPAVALLGVAIVLASTQGHRVFGPPGLFGGAFVGAFLAVLFFYKVLLPWRTRRLIPSLLRKADFGAFAPILRADENISRMLAANEQREGAQRHPGGDGRGNTTDDLRRRP